MFSLRDRNIILVLEPIKAVQNFNGNTIKGALNTEEKFAFSTKIANYMKYAHK